jgi:hypothetical protein
MISNSGIRSILSRIQPLALVVSAGALGFWLGQARGDRTQMVWPLGIMLLAAAAALGWQLLPRGSRRIQAVWNAYADREIARLQLRQATR